MADETQIYTEFTTNQGGIANKQKLMTPSLHYHKSLSEVSNFLTKYWLGETHNRANLSLELSNDAEKLAVFSSILDNTLCTFEFTKDQQAIIESAQLESTIQKYLADFEEVSYGGKINILYEVALLSYQYTEIADLFVHLIKNYVSEPGNIENMTNLSILGSRSIYPLDEQLEKIIFIILEARNTKILDEKTDTHFQKFL
jgi:hypothetical protein